MKITYLNLDFAMIVQRYYLMMAVVIIPFFLGLPFLALLAVPIFISCMLGMKIEFLDKSKAITKSLEIDAISYKEKRA